MGEVFLVWGVGLWGMQESAMPEEKDYQAVIGRAIAVINARLAQCRSEHEGKDDFSVSFLLDQLELCREWLRKYGGRDH